MSELGFCTVYIPSGRRYTGAKRPDVTGAWGPVGMSKAATGPRALFLLLSAMFGMYRHAHLSPGAGDVTLLLWIKPGQELVSCFLENQNGGR